MTRALRDMFASISRYGAAEDPLAAVCKSAVRCLPEVQFAYYCYKGEETGRLAAIRENVPFFMPSPDVERKIVAVLWRKAHGDEVSVLKSKTTRPLLSVCDRERWTDFAGYVLRLAGLLERLPPFCGYPMAETFLMPDGLLGGVLVIAGTVFLFELCGRELVIPKRSDERDDGEEPLDSREKGVLRRPLCAFVAFVYSLAVLGVVIWLVSRPQ